MRGRSSCRRLLLATSSVRVREIGGSAYHYQTGSGVVSILSVVSLRDGAVKGSSMTSPTLIIPEDLMHPNKKKEVLTLLHDAPAERKLKAQLLLAWAQEVGITLRQRDYDYVQSHALDG